jgi:hypothetical protein
MVALAILYSVNNALVFLPAFTQGRHRPQSFWTVLFVFLLLSLCVFESPFGGTLDIHVIASYGIDFDRVFIFCGNIGRALDGALIFGILTDSVE